MVMIRASKYCFNIVEFKVAACLLPPNCHHCPRSNLFTKFRLINYNIFNSPLSRILLFDYLIYRAVKWLLIILQSFKIRALMFKQAL